MIVGALEVRVPLLLSIEDAEAATRDHWENVATAKADV
jgi:hypothetical protein